MANCLLLQVQKKEITIMVSTKVILVKRSVQHLKFGEQTIRVLYVGIYDFISINGGTSALE